MDAAPPVSQRLRDTYATVRTMIFWAMIDSMSRRLTGESTQTWHCNSAEPGEPSETWIKCPKSGMDTRELCGPLGPHQRSGRYSAGNASARMAGQPVGDDQIGR